MNTRKLSTLSSLVIAVLTAYSGYAAEITATGSGNWSSTVPDAPWPDGIVPGPNDGVEVPAGITITVDTNVTVGYIFGSGTVVMGPGTTLTVVGDEYGAYGTQTLETLDATAPSNTVVYMCNAFWAKRTDYYNLVLTNPIAYQYDFYNGPIPGYPAVPMTISGDMTVVGRIRVQQGAKITVQGNLLIGTNATWDCSSFYLTVGSNTVVDGLLLDLDGALGSNYFGGNLTVSSTAVGWNLGDVIHWGIGGSLTNDGFIVGRGYGSISFEGAGFIAGRRPIRIPTMTVAGTYEIATTITLVTNTPTLRGTLVFDIARTNQIILLTNAGTALYYDGHLVVTNSGVTPVAGASYKLFNCTNGYGGVFRSITLPSLPVGLSWVDNLLTTGSIDVVGVGLPVLNVSRTGQFLTLSWDSTTYPGYRVEAQTNAAGIGTNWGPTDSGTVSPYVVPIDPTKPAVFFRLVKP